MLTRNYRRPYVVPEKDLKLLEFHNVHVQRENTMALQGN